MISKVRLAQAVCLALTLTFVPGILCAVTVASGYGVYLEFQEWRSKKTESVGNSTYESLAVDFDGRAAVAVHDSHSRAVGYLDAERLPINTGNESVRWLVGCWLLRPPEYRLPWHGPREYPIESLDQAKKDENWFLIWDRQAGRAVFEGYDAITHRPIGYIGLEGFAEGPRDEAKGFPVVGALRWGTNLGLLTRSNFNYLFHEYERARVRFDNHEPLQTGQWVLLSDERLFLVDSAARSVTELFPRMKVRSMAAASRLLPATSDPAPAAAGGERQFEYQKLLAVRTADRVFLINPNAGGREEYVLPVDWKERDFQIYLPSDGTAVLTSPAGAGRARDNPSGIVEHAHDVVAVSSVGDIVRQTRIVLQYSFNPARQPSERSRYWLTTLAVPGPLPSAVAAGVILPWFDSRIHQTRFADREVVSLGQTWPVLAFVTLMATGLTWRVDRHLRACREPRSFVWLAFVFLLGLPGYVAWHCHRRWPVRHPVPPPEKTGTEIFG